MGEKRELQLVIISAKRADKMTFRPAGEPVLVRSIRVALSHCTSAYPDQR
jgi:hypothetical protein